MGTSYDNDRALCHFMSHIQHIINMRIGMKRFTRETINSKSYNIL